MAGSRAASPPSALERASSVPQEAQREPQPNPTQEVSATAPTAALNDGAHESSGAGGPASAN